MIRITEVSPEDAEIIADVGSRSFYDAFASSNSHDDMQKYLSEKFSPINIRKEISDSRAKFYLASYESLVVGYMKLINGDVPKEIKDKNSLELQRIYVLKEYYNKKIGNELMQLCIDYAAKNSFSSVWLGVWNQNKRAIEFYKRWGFEIFGERNFKLGNDVKDDFLMLKYL